MDLSTLYNKQAALEDELNSLLAEEYIAWFQYYSIAMFLKGHDREDVAKFFMETADDELNDHAAKLIKRIKELNFDLRVVTPESWNCFAHNKFKFEGFTTTKALLMNHEAEIGAIEHYNKVKELALGLEDYETADLLQYIIGDEENHRIDIEEYLQNQK